MRPLAGDWDQALQGFGVASAPLVHRREMQRRAESKFVMPVADALALLPALQRDYAVLPAGDAVLAAYRTLYFDTADLAFFHAHRRGRRVRHKVRIRHYPDRAVSFLEVKTRLGENLTAKARRPRAHGDSTLHPDDVAFVRANGATSENLFPQVWTDFRRVTLLGTELDERVTVDFDLRLTGSRRACSLADLAVVEVKQPRPDRGSVAMEALRRAGWKEGWASKYCLGIAMTGPAMEEQWLRPELRSLQEGVGCPR